MDPPFVHDVVATPVPGLPDNPKERPFREYSSILRGKSPRGKSGGRTSTSTMEFKSNFANNKFVADFGAGARFVKFEQNYVSASSPSRGSKARSVSPLRASAKRERAQMYDSRNLNGSLLGHNTSQSPRRLLQEVRWSPGRTRVIRAESPRLAVRGSLGIMDPMMPMMLSYDARSPAVVETRVAYHHMYVARPGHHQDMYIAGLQSEVNQLKQ
jgi:hypothetical protein